jgi:N-succinyldiaminopimelate aminotransferase
LAPERTFASLSNSKHYGMAGNRCGFMIGPESVMKQAQKISTHSFYSTPTASQMAACAALTSTEGSEWVQHARSTYLELGTWAANRLGESAPKAGTFLFLDVQDALDERGLMPLLEQCVDKGLLVAPGPSFGPYPTFVRLCFTSIEPHRMKEGVEIFAQLLGR